MSLSTLSPLLPLLVCLAALGLDRLCGEPRPHPLVWFGTFADAVERRCNHRRTTHATYWRGAAALCIAVAVPLSVMAGGLWWLATYWPSSLMRAGVDTLLLYLLIGWQSMKEHTRTLAAALTADDLPRARTAVAQIVSRQTTTMTRPQIIAAGVESILENGNDCVFATLFWYIVFGPLGALLHRLVNTLDAMWGYKTPRFLRFGMAAARLDDVLGYLPARLTALCYALSGAPLRTLRTCRAQGRAHASPNAGLVIASGAGVLQVTIGGPAIYHGQLKQKPYVGCGPQAQTADLARAIRLVQRGLVGSLILYGGGLWLYG